jgi:type VI secretion system protein ImpG
VDPRLLQYYNRELEHVQEMGAEFAKEFPKIAGRLGMEDLPCSDPYVERLLEGFAFMAARIQLKIDAEFPKFTQSLLEIVYPHYLKPIPSMLIAQMSPDLADPGLADGHLLPRETALHGGAQRDERTACEYRTAHDLTLWPIELTEVRYFPTAGSLSNINVEGLNGSRAGIRFSLRCTTSAFDELALDALPLYLAGTGDVSRELYEQLLGNCTGMVVRPKGGANAWQMRMPASAVRQHGFRDDQRLLPYTRRSFEGYRLLQEYYAFPERFLFVELSELGEAVRRNASTELEIIVLLDRSVGWLEGSTDKDQFALFCTPAINLFDKRADRAMVDRRKSEFHVIPDRTRPMDFEIYSVERMQGYSDATEIAQEFRPFYTTRDATEHREELAYFSINREPRAISSKQRREGTRSSYVGSEVFVSIVDANEAPYSPDLKQLEFHTLCTNRDLPLQMTLGIGATDFTLDVSAPIKSIWCLGKPTIPRPAPVYRESSWRLLSHLSLNYISVVQDDAQEGALLLRQMLGLYGDPNDATIRKQIEGLKSISSKSVVRRLPTAGPVSFGRGLELELLCEDNAFEGTGVFLFGAVMDEFFARYVSLNSFTETVLRTDERGEVMRWPTRIGRLHRL